MVERFPELEVWEAAVEKLAGARKPNLKYLEKCLETEAAKRPQGKAAEGKKAPEREYPLWALVSCPRCGGTTRVEMTTHWEPQTLKCTPCDRIMAFGSWRWWAFGNVPLSPISRD